MGIKALPASVKPCKAHVNWHRTEPDRGAAQKRKLLSPVRSSTLAPAHEISQGERSVLSDPKNKKGVAVVRCQALANWFGLHGVKTPEVLLSPAPPASPHPGCSSSKRQLPSQPGPPSKLGPAHH